MIDNRNQPHFLNLDESLTEDGRALIAFIESQFKEADESNDLESLKAGLSGMIGHYYVNVFKTRAMTPERWVRDYPNGAMNAWSAKQFVEAEAAKSQTIVDTANKTSDLEAQLNAFKEALNAEMEAVKAQNAALREELDALKAGRGKKPAKAVEPAPEPETTDAPEGNEPQEA